MKKKNVLSHWSQCLLGVAVLALGLAGTSCEKIKDDEMVDIIVPYYLKDSSVYGRLEDHRHTKAMSDDSLRNCAAHPYVRRIYIAIPFPYEQYFLYSSRGDIFQMSLQLSKKMAISPKITGRGNFRFEPGVCSEKDSLSFISMGFTVNQEKELYK